MIEKMRHRKQTKDMSKAVRLLKKHLVAEVLGKGTARPWESYA